MQSENRKFSKPFSESIKTLELCTIELLLL